MRTGPSRNWRRRKWRLSAESVRGVRPKPIRAPRRAIGVGIRGRRRPVLVPGSLLSCRRRSSAEFCPRCQAEAYPGTTSCHRCGYPVPAPAGVGAGVPPVMPLAEAQQPFGQPHMQQQLIPSGFTSASSGRLPGTGGQNRPPLVAVGAACLAIVLALGGAVWYTSGGSRSPDSSDGEGVAPPLEQVSSDWLSAPAVADGLSVKYPSDWQLNQITSNVIVMRQPGSPDDRPVPNIAFSFEPGVTVTQPGPADGMSPAQPVTVAGLQGWEYHQTGLVTPSASTFIDLPYLGGRLQITATRGPTVNLVPQLEEILKTMVVAQ